MREYVLVFLIGVAVSFMLTPPARSLALRLGAVARVRNRDVHHDAIPYFGGLAMLGGVAATFFLASRLPFLTRYSFVTKDSVTILIAGAIICAVGVIDDLIELNALTKVAGQVLAAGATVLGGVRMQWIPWRGGIITLDPAASVLITVVAVFLCANAINLIDGLDGLAAGIVAISAFSFFVYSYWLTVAEDLARAQTASLVTIAICAICIGYLPHNFHPATIFMGDSGSMLLGLLFASSMISLTSQIEPTSLADRSGLLAAYIPLIMPIVALGLPFLDMVMAYTRRTWKGVWWFVADKQHLHHRLLQRGHTQVRAVFLMYGWTALLAFSALALGLHPSLLTASIVVVVVVSTVIFAVVSGRNLVLEESEKEGSS
ncbi:MAG: undecaprenyl/decaprenyl-phosphate alpha-N-acetylglucosaminyl 1-phosphate transferase [Propionibacteriaceae bacterium]|jgi:UDP-GlcNAc:undecaprenyl-phosphate GlcNAc-1-phosphate transferase|nr:undecaprenyl/decaprenyl-phosphate alpha-N-acetylglucosaminyl 1-phosphate transferase [Propionibacteriaceae bacterium]